jgi:hypothetical protein
MTAAHADAREEAPRSEVEEDHSLAVERALRECDDALAVQIDAAVRRFGGAALGVVDLPPLRGGRIEPEQLGVVAVLWWAREVEEAGLLEFTEKLAEGIFGGRLILPLRGSMAVIAEYRRERIHRFSLEERRLLYARLFEDSDVPSGGVPFAATFDSLVEALGDIARAPLQEPLTHLQARASTIGRELAAELSARSAGVAAFAARDIVQHVRTALRLLANREIVFALGPHPPFELVRIHARMVIGRDVDPSRHIARADAGRKILAWLARSAHGVVLPIGRRDEVVVAATTFQALPTSTDSATTPAPSTTTRLVERVAAPAPPSVLPDAARPS